MPKIEHVFYDRENPKHREHLALFFKLDDIEDAESNALSAWGSKEHKGKSLKQLMKEKREEMEQEHREEGVSGDQELGEHDRIVLQFVDGNPSGYVWYNVYEPSEQYIDHLYLLPEFRDTHVEHTEGKRGDLPFLERHVIKREPQLRLAEKMLEFIGGNPVFSMPLTASGIGFVDKHAKRKRK